VRSDDEPVPEVAPSLTVGSPKHGEISAWRNDDACDSRPAQVVMLHGPYYLQRMSSS
jgi:hypothetical protein